MRLRLSWRTVAVIGVGALVLPALGSASFASSARVSVAGSMPDWARSAHATGNASASSTLSVNVILPLRGGDAAQQLALSISTPKSENYGQYLTPAQFNAKFAPTASSVAKVRSYLAGQGLKVTGVAEGNRWVSVSGTVKQLNKAFGVSLKNFNYQGKSEVAPSANATLPASIAPLVAGITGLSPRSLIHTTDHKVAHQAPLSKSANGKLKVGPSTDAIAPSVKPDSHQPPTQNCSVYWGQFRQKVPTAYGKDSLPTYNCGYFPQQVQTAYGTADAVNGGDTGKGVTVAIIDAYLNPTQKSDLNAFSDFVGIPELKSGQYSSKGSATSFNDFNECGGSDGWYEEAALDVDAVHGMAPGANIHFLGAKNCDDGIDDEINYAIQHHVADEVSNSYGDEGEDLGSELTLEHSFFVQAATEGIGFYFSTGDDGDETDDPANPTPIADYPATDPLVTAVGGTSLGVNEDGSKLFETSWGSQIDLIDYPAKGHSHYDSPLPGDIFGGGGGGGVSSKFTQPFYQKNIVPPSLSKMNGKTAMRTTPDVSMDADPYVGYFFAVTLEGQLEGGAIGGTSLACPLFAGVQALAGQGRPVAIGFANPLMYNLGSLEFNDVNNPAKVRATAEPSAVYVTSFGFDSSLTAVKGYDDATGMGSPNGLLFLVGEEL